MAKTKRRKKTPSAAVGAAVQRMNSGADARQAQRDAAFASAKRQGVRLRFLAGPVVSPDGSSKMHAVTADDVDIEWTWREGEDLEIPAAVLSFCEGFKA